MTIELPSMSPDPEEGTPAPAGFPDDPQRLLDSNSLAGELGIGPRYAPDEQSPPVDEVRLRAFVRQTCPADERDLICRWIARFRPWHQAWAQILREDIPSPPATE